MVKLIIWRGVVRMNVKNGGSFWMVFNESDLLELGIISACRVTRDDNAVRHKITRPGHCLDFLQTIMMQ